MDENAPCRMLSPSNACRCLEFDSLCPTGAVQRFSSSSFSTPHPNLPWQQIIAIAGDHGIWCGTQIETVSPRDRCANPSLDKAPSRSYQGLRRFGAPNDPYIYILL